ncbi:hypothetical protein F5Y17DRAFT_458256 [Xylariaceae sp. FL0594]|nr:hypothetical protein F5Y17DRAFT_458256 [Xylariaceae sp. FL0594]
MAARTPSPLSFHQLQDLQQQVWQILFYDNDNTDCGSGDQARSLITYARGLVLVDRAIEEITCATTLPSLDGHARIIIQSREEEETEVYNNSPETEEEEEDMPTEMTPAQIHQRLGLELELENMLAALLCYRTTLHDRISASIARESDYERQSCYRVRARARELDATACVEKKKKKKKSAHVVARIVRGAHEDDDVFEFIEQRKGHTDTPTPTVLVRNSNSFLDPREVVLMNTYRIAIRWADLEQLRVRAQEQKEAEVGVCISY